MKLNLSAIRVVERQVDECGVRVEGGGARHIQARRACLQGRLQRQAPDYRAVAIVEAVELQIIKICHKNVASKSHDGIIGDDENEFVQAKVVAFEGASVRLL